MGLSLGGSKGSSKSSMQQSVTPTNPAWVAPQLQGLSTNTAGLSSADPYSFVAGAAPLQTQAATAAGGLTQNTGSYTTANSTLGNLSTAGPNTQANVATVHPNSILPNLNAYMDPYTNDVVNSSLADYDYGAGQTQAQNKLALAGDDTFGGSGGAIQTAASNADLTRGRATLSSGLRDQAFNTGAGLASQDADRRQQAQLANQAAYNNQYQFNANQADTAQARQAAAAQALVGVDQSGNADARANIGLQGDLGTILQQIMQNQAGAPLTTQQAINSAYASLPLGLLHGQDTTGSSKGSQTQLSAGYKS